MADRIKRIPPIGCRILKSAVSVFLCFLVDLVRRGTPFYSALAALQCMQPYKDSTRKIAVQRLLGTAVGAVYGFIVIVLQMKVLAPYGLDGVWRYALVALFVVIVLYTTVLLHKKNASYFSCVVFLSITMIHMSDANPYLFVLNRVADTLIGVAIGMVVNQAHLPRRLKKDVLYVSELDNVLLSDVDQLSGYSKVELNRLIDDGIQFTIMTMRTPASFLEAAQEIQLKLPIILMNGAVLYDIQNNRYIHKIEISHQEACEIEAFFSERGHNCFMTVIAENTVMILYQQLHNAGEIAVYEKLRKSPYRNYMHKPLSAHEDVAYFMVVDEKSRIDALYEEMESSPFGQRFQIIHYDSVEYPHFAYLKVYSRQATKQTMLTYLKTMLGVENACTIGSVPGEYDIVSDEKHSGNDVIRLLKAECAPTAWNARRKA